MYTQGWSSTPNRAIAKRGRECWVAPHPMKPKHAGILLLAVAYLAAMFMVLRRTTEEVVSDRITIRLSQWQLEGTVRQAIDAIIARYEQLNPHVKVEHIAVPDSVYLQWVQTQMVGGTGPDIVEYVWVWPNVARYFQPIDAEVLQPNPYNRGTPLEGVPWRETNVDGMTNDDSFVKSLNRYYGITLTSHIPRIVFNKKLLHTITGRSEPPRTYREFLQLCREVDVYAKATDRVIAPLATSKDSYPFIMFPIVGNALTKLAARLDHRHRLQLTDPEAAMHYLRGEWSFDTPDVVASLQLLREFGEVSTPGFLQRTRDSALTDFVNGRALMAVMPSWDASSLLLICPFEIGAFRFPHPREDDPVYGRFTQGPFSEGQVMTGMGFFVNRLTKHREQAIDFLRFLTSQEGSQLFTDISHWQPATVGVKPSHFAAQFTQETEGNAWGVSFMTLSGIDAGMFLRAELSSLWGSGGSVEAYRTVVQQGLPGRLRDDLRREERAARENIRREDALAAAALRLSDPAQAPELLRLVTVANELKPYQMRDVHTHAVVP